MRKFFSTLGNGVLVLVLLGAGFFFLGPRLGLTIPVEVKVVRSGSMEPAIQTGSLVFLLLHQGNYREGEVITFGADTRTAIPTTHRIISVGSDEKGTFYTTKGDANEDPDPGETRTSEIIGRVAFSVPYAGYILSFARTKLGFFLIILIPTILIILNEFIAIYGEFRGVKNRRQVYRALAELARERSEELAGKKAPEPMVLREHVLDLRGRLL